MRAPRGRWSLASSALVGATLWASLAAFPGAAVASPDQPAKAPDSGARPTPAGPLVLPSGGSTAFPGSFPGSAAGANTAPLPPKLGPLATKIAAAEAAVALLGEQLTQATLDRDANELQARNARLAWQVSSAALTAARQAAQQAAPQAYKDVAALPPGIRGGSLTGLGTLTGRRDQASPREVSADSMLARAQADESYAAQARDLAVNRAADTTKRHKALKKAFTTKQAALVDLRQRNADQLAAIARESEKYEQQIGKGYQSTIKGLGADPRAVKALRFALDQLGEWYLWGATGPGRWDCSGLMLRAYESVGYQLPRVAVDQYTATKDRTVDPHQLLPGDLLFFATPQNDPSRIHHVAMYLGDGKMVHAPGDGQQVQVSTVWWSHFFAATRVFGGISKPNGGATSIPPIVPPKPAPTQTPKPSTSAKPPKPNPTPTKSPKPTTSPIPHPTSPAPVPSNPPPSTEPTAPTEPTPSTSTSDSV